MWVMLHSAFAMAIDAEYFGMSKCLVLHSCIFNQVPVSFIIAAPPPQHTQTTMIKITVRKTISMEEILFWLTIPYILVHCSGKGMMGVWELCHGRCSHVRNQKVEAVEWGVGLG